MTSDTESDRRCGVDLALASSQEVYQQINIHADLLFPRKGKEIFLDSIL